MEVHRTRLLLVEDNPIHAKLMIRQLAAVCATSEIEWAKDGEAALERLQADPLPDLVLLDLKLPKLDGHDVLRSIKQNERLKGIPVVMVTTSNWDEDVSRAYELGASAYLVKPLDCTEWRSMLSHVVQFWGAWDRIPSCVTRENGARASAAATA
jgi:CheY-like chemotaxis protein